MYREKLILTVAFLLLGLASYGSAKSKKCGDNQNPVRLMFLKIGGYRGQDSCSDGYHKQYFIPRFVKTEWYEANAFCESYGMELASIENQKEAVSLLGLLAPHKSKTDDAFFLGGMGLEKQNASSWYWTGTGKKFSSDLEWLDGYPDASVKQGLPLLCLGAVKIPRRTLGLGNTMCSRLLNKFVCEKRKNDNDDEYE